MATRIQIRRDTEVDWLTNNPVLSLGEVGYITSTGELVVGDGSTPFVDLPRIAPSTMSFTRVNYGADHTLAYSDLGKRLRSTAVITLTIPNDSNRDLPIDIPTEIYAAGGTVSIVADTEVDIHGGTLLNQYSTASLIKDGPNEWVVVGQAQQ